MNSSFLFSHWCILDHIAVSSMAPQITNIHSIHVARMAELEEGSGTEASDTQLLEEFDSIHSEDYVRCR